MAFVVHDGELIHTSVFDIETPRPKPWGRTLENYFMEHVMLDLETMGTRPGCPVIAIGAVAFDPRSGEMGETFYGIAHSDQSRHGLRASQQTTEWWAAQSPEARSIFFDVRAKPLPVLLTEFTQWLAPYTKVKLWGNGSDFDNTVLQAAYEACNFEAPWNYYFNRCYRTVKNLAPHVKMKRLGTHHNALDDAKSQAQHLMDIVQQTTLTLA